MRAGLFSRPRTPLWYGSEAQSNHYTCFCPSQNQSILLTEITGQTSKRAFCVTSMTADLDHSAAQRVVMTTELSRWTGLS